MWKTRINAERLFMVRPTLVTRTAKGRQAGTCRKANNPLHGDRPYTISRKSCHVISLFYCGIPPLCVVPGPLGSSRFSPVPENHDNACRGMLPWSIIRKCTCRSSRCSLTIHRNTTEECFHSCSVFYSAFDRCFLLHSAKSFSVNLWLFFHRTRTYVECFRVFPLHDPIHHRFE